MQSTLQIFKIFYNQLPSLVPGNILDEMEKSLRDLENSQDASLEDVEEIMIKFGYQVWPWHKAHREFLSAAEEKIGDHFVLHKLPSSLQDKYKKYRAYGMSPTDLHSEQVLGEYFDQDERGDLSRAVVDARMELKDFVGRQIVGLDREKFMHRVDELNDLLDDIKIELAALKNMAENETEHENLANEIMSKVKQIEYGLCLLGPELKKEEVEQAAEFFRGRKHELGRMKGIHRPVTVDFYGEE